MKKLVLVACAFVMAAGATALACDKAAEAKTASNAEAPCAKKAAEAKLASNSEAPCDKPCDKKKAGEATLASNEEKPCAKKAAEAKKKQKVIEVKEVKFRPNTDTHDYDVKMRNVTRFLEAGDKVKVTLRFRGREMAHQNLGRNLLERVAEDIEGLGKVENMPKMEGRQMVMMIGPVK